MFAADLDCLRELRNQCAHNASTSHHHAEQAHTTVFGNVGTGILATPGQ
jgi:hypothetical protein